LTGASMLSNCALPNCAVAARKRARAAMDANARRDIFVRLEDRLDVSHPFHKGRGMNGHPNHL